MEAAFASTFATTHWSVVLAARDSGSSSAAAALEKLCGTYWFPLYAFVRWRGHSPEAAADLTQSFFTHLLGGDFLQRARRERGRFRSYLLGALNHFLAGEAERDSRQKRGGGRPVISLDALEPADTADSEKLFARRWAMTIVDQALRRLEAEMLVAGKEKLFGRLSGFLLGEKGDGNYAEAGAELGLSEAAVKMAVQRLRGRCRELLRETIAQTVLTPVEVDEEYSALINALRG